jgi:hypothetical protein
MTTDEALTAIRDIIQEDVGGRGLRSDPNDNLITAFPRDFATACRSIAETPNPMVVVLTGFYIAAADPPCGETDGPLGALFLARALPPLGIRVGLQTDPFCRRALEAGLAACGSSVPVQTIPPASHPWDTFLEVDWSGFVEREGLTHLVAIERVGPATDGRCYSMRGRAITEFTNPAHLIVEDLAKRPGITTIGIGDGGNEIGMGKLPRDTIARNIPNGEMIACRVPTDHLIVAGVSNWGAYALAAGVALLRGQRLDPLLFDLDRERELLQVMVDEGPLVDGMTLQRITQVDGFTFEKYAEPLRKIGEIVAECS